MEVEEQAERFVELIDMRITAALGVVHGGLQGSFASVVELIKSVDDRVADLERARVDLQHQINTLVQRINDRTRAINDRIDREKRGY